jgi:hypothetical protein
LEPLSLQHGESSLGLPNPAGCVFARPALSQSRRFQTAVSCTSWNGARLIEKLAIANYSRVIQRFIASEDRRF